MRATCLFQCRAVPLGVLLALAVCLPGAFPANNSPPAVTPPTEEQKAQLKEILHLLPKSEPWEKWLQTSGTMPPNFNALSNTPFLPDPLRFGGGREVKREDWPRRRAELLTMFQHYVTGVWPLSPPGFGVAEQKQREEGGALIQEVTLEFGPRRAAKLHVELLVPKGQGPFPVFITQDTHRQWALVAVSRGYVGCVYAGADSRDDTESWKAVWPDFDWTRLTRRAWAASRCVDYLLTLPFVKTNQIALTGHSRNGKTSLIGAAFDQRISAVISSSSGAGGACSYRLFSEAEFGEGIENITRAFPDWLHPRLRFFVGREQKLPIDQPELIACIAPRPCLISSALNDNVESIWAIEHSYHSARRVYELVGKGYDLNLRYRPGGHETRAEDIEAYVDWLDSVFGRQNFPLPDCTIFPTYDDWLKQQPEPIDPSIFATNGLGDLLELDGTAFKTTDPWLRKRDRVRERILWGLGNAPAFAESEPGSYGAEAAHRSTLLGRANPPADIARRSINFGNYLSGDLYYPTNADRTGRKLPVVIWLHPISVSSGYVAGYRRGEHPHLALAKTGCAVFAFDQIGNGTRIEEVRNFYGRYPGWSLLGKQVEDTLAAVEALQKIDVVDGARVWLLGYGTGSMIALHAAALHERIAGVCTVAGFTPMRSDVLAKGTGGIARWSRWLPLQPKLAAFLTQEQRIPYDYHELLAMIAPRPITVFAPRIDRYATLADVKTCVEDAKRVYELFAAKDALRFEELDDYNHFSPETQKVVFERLHQMGGF
jgi:pimeloyl-ACP methyl ester carboxylesterase